MGILKRIFFILFPACYSCGLLAQDTSKSIIRIPDSANYNLKLIGNALKIDSSYQWDFSGGRISFPVYRSFNLFDRRFPEKSDSEFVKAHFQLTDSVPSTYNYAEYYQLATSLWKTGRDSEAEKMLKTIIKSKAPYYSNSLYFSSDIPGDTTHNAYRYGSYVFNYKHYACKFLSYIYIIRKEYRKALHYIRLADHTHKVQFNCGTGYRYYEDEIIGIYSTCYQGLGKYEPIIKHYFSYCLEAENDALIWALQKKYSQKQLNNYLESALKSIRFIGDSEVTHTFYVTYRGDNHGDTTYIKYKDGSATIRLFGHDLEMPYQCRLVKENSFRMIIFGV
jgi:hypothetical protein